MATKVSDIIGGGAYLKAADLQGKRHAVTIEAWEIEEGKFGRQIVLSFVGKDKKLTLNKTNARMITNLLNTDDLDAWIGHAITLRPDRTPNPDGAMVDCVRVDFELPEQAGVGQGVQAAQSASAPVNYGAASNSHVLPPPADDDVPF